MAVMGAIVIPILLAVLLLELAYYADEVAAGFAGLVVAWRQLFHKR